MVGAVIIFAMTLLLVTVIFKPRLGWYLIEGWRYKHLEPAGDILALSRVSAFIFLFLIWFVVVPFTSVI